MSVKVKDRMSSPLVTIDKEKFLRDAAKKMEDHEIGSLGVTGDNEDIEGIITERDLVNAIGRNQFGVKIYGYMSKPLISINQNKSISAAAQKMLEKGIRRLMVIDDNEKVVGIINMRDIIMGVHESFLALLDA